MRTLTTRKAYLSASSRGLAFHIAKRLASEGAEVALSSRSAANLAVARERILQEVPDATVLTVPGDLSIRADQARILDTLALNSFSPDIFVCSAGQPPDLQVPTVSRERWDHDLEMILGQATFATQRFVPAMAQKRYGRVLFISSTIARTPGRHFLTSSITRAGLVALSKSLVDEYAHDSVASFVLCLGYVDTPLLRNMALDRDFDAPDPETGAGPGTPWKARYEQWARTIPAGRIGTPQELADLAAFLASPAAEYLNGSVLDFAGGLVAGTL
jgi:3-oxoacyl-[acyl-carrier protein] reductase